MLLGSVFLLLFVAIITHSLSLSLHPRQIMGCCWGAPPRVYQQHASPSSPARPLVRIVPIGDASPEVIYTATDVKQSVMGRRDEAKWSDGSFFAMIGPIPVGVVEYRTRGPRAVSVKTLVVHPHFRRKGIGRQLLVDTWPPGFEVTVSAPKMTEDGPASLTFWRSMGFAVVSEDEHEWHLRVTTSVLRAYA